MSYSEKTRLYRKLARAGISNAEARRMAARRDGTRCWYCRKFENPEKMTLEHVMPLSKGGAHALENWRLACHACNFLVGNKRPGQKERIRREMQQSAGASA